jgi:hypothetical protein
MSHFAHISNGIVDQVIVIDQETLNTGHWGNPADWIQTSYNTRGGVHYGSDNQPDGGVALRGNYAGVGYTYDAEHDVFYPPKPYPSWTISAPTWIWIAPTPMPTDGKMYVWNEETTSWNDVTPKV